jgi:hypothetical protein
MEGEGVGTTKVVVGEPNPPNRNKGGSMGDSSERNLGETGLGHSVVGVD